LLSPQEENKAIAKVNNSVVVTFIFVIFNDV